jgi:hypothetical protein
LAELQANINEVKSHEREARAVLQRLNHRRELSHE